jgi:hypothetical protein
VNDPDLTDEEGSLSHSLADCVSPSHISKSSKKHRHRKSRGIVKKRPLKLKSWNLDPGELAMFHDDKAKLIVNELETSKENQKANSLHGILPHDPSLPEPERIPFGPVTAIPLQSPFRSSFDFDSHLPTTEVDHRSDSPEPLPQNLLESPIAQRFLYLDD